MKFSIFLENALIYAFFFFKINVASYLTDTVRDLATQFLENNIFKDYEGFKNFVAPNPEDSVIIVNHMKEAGAKVNQCIGQKLDSTNNIGQ